MKDKNQTNKKKLLLNIVFIISFIIIAITMMVAIIGLINSQTYDKDALKFKTEIEQLNNKKISDNYTAYKVNIPEKNPIIYATDDTILDILKNGRHIVYFGFPDCPWCRRILPTLFEVAKEEKIQNIYYYNFKEIRQAYIDETDSAKVKLYKDIINIIGEDISLTFGESDKTVRDEIKDTKKITAPYLFALKDGKVTISHANAVESYKDHSKDMTNEQKEELKNIYKSFFTKANGFDKCDIKQGC